LRTVDSPHCKCNGGGGKSFFPMCFGRRWTYMYINFLNKFS
jgi:hypothetical protein